VAAAKSSRRFAAHGGGGGGGKGYPVAFGGNAGGAGAVGRLRQLIVGRVASPAASTAAGGAGGNDAGVAIGGDWIPGRRLLESVADAPPRPQFGERRPATGSTPSHGIGLGRRWGCRGLRDQAFPRAAIVISWDGGNNGAQVRGTVGV
jgi:hypothetical protein